MVCSYDPGHLGVDESQHVVSICQEWEQLTSTELFPDFTGTI